MADLASPLVRGNYILLRADALRLLMPQSDVGAAAYLEHQPRATDMPGVFEHGGIGGGLPVMALSQTLAPLTEYPAERFVTTPIDTPQGKIDFGWSEVTVLIDAQLRRIAVPGPMLAPDSPLAEFVEIGGHVAFCCESARLMDYALATGQ